MSLTVHAAQQRPIPSALPASQTDASVPQRTQGFGSGGSATQDGHPGSHGTPAGAPHRSSAPAQTPDSESLSLD
ncbi:hypothetical protein Ae168Ps1_6379 [Pseudonocardia sp. Ae168_Ps1]|nr:hypothetical protein Ae150APs1_6188c [Pseudonocardia sp. Ae150A_Ps1]OLL70142.1 hypothetical protein Ae168Ps1_6379 [Pseudonocardia sp. Ae168_Ps1]OLL70413.1 hypothetical protein Ae263Ps1_6357 [Pseudonocardia sp. Ae263_Ps1]OLL89194.1 hypothetical protein Ae356Ps1_6222 [Pseudonocardia sp. Ae356_Ps1]